jgi:photosystem II stability/assembly factor-like uncharacterized protein
MGFSGAAILFSVLLANSGSWEICGPGGTWTTGVCTVPSGGDDLLFALCSYSTAGSECRVSTDNGDSWELSATADFNAFSICSDSFGRIFIGGEDCLLLSSDSGDSWALVYTCEGARTQSVAADPADPQHLLAAVTDCEQPLMKSTDGGYSWNTCTSLPSGVSGMAVAFFPDDPDAVLLAGYTNARYKLLVVYMSTDGGDSWTDVSPAPPFPFAASPRIDLVVAPGDPCVVCLSAECRVWRSEDGCASWSHPLTTVHQITGLTLTETPGTVYAVTGDSFYSSLDHGLSWQNSSELPASATAVAVTCCPGERIHVATINGIYSSTSPQGEWVFSNNGIPGKDIYSLLSDRGGSGFPISTGFHFLHEGQFSWSPCGALPLFPVWEMERSYSDPAIFHAAGDAG